MYSPRSWKLKAFTGGSYGTVADTRSFATSEAAERAASELRRTGWTARVWQQRQPAEPFDETPAEADDA